MNTGICESKKNFGEVKCRVDFCIISWKYFVIFLVSIIFSTVYALQANIE